jgi:hypothetical protein
VDDGSKARRLLVLLVAAEVAAVVTLHRLGRVDGFAIPRRDLGRWLQQTPSEDVLLTGVRLAALVAAWWLLGTTLLYVAARVARVRGAARAIGWATLPMVRRWADRAAAVSIVAASALGAARPAGADPPPTTSAPAPVVVDVDHRDRSKLSDLPPATARTGRGADSTPTTTGSPPATVPAPPSTSALPPAPSHAIHVIVPGEHLWSIAADHVAGDEIARYWRRVVELNRSRLRSGDPNLVYPGVVVELPPL